MNLNQTEIAFSTGVLAGMTDQLARMAFLKELFDYGVSREDLITIGASTAEADSLPVNGPSSSSDRTTAGAMSPETVRALDRAFGSKRSGPPVTTSRSGGVLASHVRGERGGPPAQSYPALPKLGA